MRVREKQAEVLCCSLGGREDFASCALYSIAEIISSKVDRDKDLAYN